MYISYVMGIDELENKLNDDTFTIVKVGKNYRVSFSKDNASKWEEFISYNLELNFWNEYITDNSVVFLFHLIGGIKRFEVENFENDEVLALFERLCACKFESIKSMLMGNSFYKEKLIIK